MAQRAEMTVTKCTLTSCVWACFLIGSTLCLDSDIVSPHRLHWVEGVCLFRFILPPALLASCDVILCGWLGSKYQLTALLAEWPGSFTCHCGNTGMERTLNKESAHRVDSGENNSPTTPARIQTCNLSIMCPVSYTHLTLPTRRTV